MRPNSSTSVKRAKHLTVSVISFSKFLLIAESFITRAKKPNWPAAVIVFSATGPSNVVI